MTTFRRIAVVCVAVSTAVLSGAHTASAQPATPSTTPGAVATSGMKPYTDTKYGFSFWYPGALQITASSANDDASFPGGMMVETVQVGPAGGAAMHVVNAPDSAVTDEPNGHASPIAQTRFFFDAAMQIWMSQAPESMSVRGDGGAKAADMSKKTIGGLPMFASGARFDTTVIPLTQKRFIVVQDGGGSAFTNQLAATVAPAGASVDKPALAAALQVLAAALKKQ